MPLTSQRIVGAVSPLRLQASPQIVARLQSAVAAAFDQYPADVDGMHAAIFAVVNAQLIRCALKAKRGNQSHAALLLGINRNTIRKAIRAYGITPK